MAVTVPLIGALALSYVIGLLVWGEAGEPDSQTGDVLFLGLLGILSLLIGIRWYGRTGMGLRGGRPFYASTGFAVLGWVGFLLARVILVDSNPEQVVSQNSGRVFLYLLIFEALCVQLWTYGLVFHAVADWRGPLTAAVTSGVLFGAVSFLFFQEAFIPSITAFLFFSVWGVLYGFIRLRSGSLIGMVLVQAVQSLTTWHILLPQNPPNIDQLQNLYLATAILYVVFIWRLWPKEEADYRV